MRALVATALLFLASSLAADVAVAEPGGALPEAQARARLEAYNAEIKRAFTTLQGGYGQDPAAEQRRIDDATQIATGVRGALGAALSSSPAALKAVQANLSALERELANARLAQRYSAGEAAIRARHSTREPADAAELSALAQTLSELSTRGGPGWQSTVQHFQERLTRLSRERELLAAARADKQPATTTTATTTTASASVAERKTAPAPTDAALLEAFRRANKARRDLERLLEDDAGPLAEPALKAYLEATSKVSALSERAGRYYTTLYRHFLVANAFRAPDEQAFQTLPSLYQGDLAGHGSAKGKLKTRFQAEEGYCYALVGRFQTFSGAESVTGVEWSAAKGTSLARFDVPHAGPGYQVTQGVCLSAGSRVTLKASFDGAGRDNPLRYVIVGWPKENLPGFVTTYMRLLDEDRCDDDAWYRAWTRPLPGSLVYRGQEPFLVVDAGRPPQQQVTLVNVNGERVRAQKGDISSKPPKERAFQTRLDFKGCPTLSGAGSPEAEKLASCLQRVEKKYAKSIAREEGWIERASSDGAREKAEARLASLRARWEAERAKRCDPLEERLRGKVQRTFDRILDLHTENEVIVTFDRADQLRAEQEARPDLR